MADRIVTIASSGGDYTSLSAAIAGEADFQGGEDNIIFRYIEAFADTTAATITGFTTSVSNKIIIDCPGYSHNGTRGSGARLIASGAYVAVLTASIDYVEIYDLEVRNSNANAESAISISGDNCVVDSCLIYDTLGLGINQAGASGILKNTLIYSCNYGIIQGGVEAWVYYCTILNSANYGFYNTNYATLNIKNTYIGGSGTDDFKKDNGTKNITTCASEDGTLGSTISLANCAFTSFSSGSENAHIGSGSSLVNAGTDLSSDGSYPVSVDFEDDSRDSSPCIGADEYVSGGGNNISLLNGLTKSILLGGLKR